MIPQYSKELLNRYARTYQLSTTTSDGYRHCLNRWDRFGCKTLDEFRAKALEHGLSPISIENTCVAIRRMACFAGDDIDLGRPLRKPRPQPDVPTVDDVSRFYEVVSWATWPSWPGCNRVNWWQTLVVFFCWTGIRLGDVERLKWDNISNGRLEYTASKTRRTHKIPLPPFIERHLKQLRKTCRRRNGNLFGFTRTREQLGREFRQMSKLSDCRITPQRLRRFAITSWGSANGEAGRIIHGCSLGVLNHYVNPHSVLEKTLPAVQEIMPSVFFNDEERVKQRTKQQDLDELRGMLTGIFERLIQ